MLSHVQQNDNLSLAGIGADGSRHAYGALLLQLGLGLAAGALRSDHSATARFPRDRDDGVAVSLRLSWRANFASSCS
jgi:hypothetical protein